MKNYMSFALVPNNMRNALADRNKVRLLKSTPTEVICQVLKLLFLKNIF